jgi:hypothetical protein
MIRTKQILIITLILVSTITNLFSSEYSFRKYLHVEHFYNDISKDSIDVCVKYKLPPAAVMAIAGLESGYGSGYVAQITGNILSLGAFKGDNELPRLYLPYSKNDKKVLFDPNNIKKYSKSDLVWKERPKSLKRDYRPIPYAGTTKKLELLKYDAKLKDEAVQACLNDFATRWIVDISKVKVFREAKIWLNGEVSKKGINILFTKETSEEFIKRIGGHPHSFNYRRTWPKKAILIMNKVGLVQISHDMYINNRNFEQAWSIK